MFRYLGCMDNWKLAGRKVYEIWMCMPLIQEEVVEIMEGIE